MATLENNLIAIRERNLFELLELAMAVTRSHAAPLAAAFALGALPMLVLNDWLLKSFLLEVDMADGEIPFEFMYWMSLLVMIQTPLAAAPATLYLGQCMFHERIDRRQLFRDFRRSLPQLLVLQGLLRGFFCAFFFLALPPLIPYISWPYLSEIILLERNPLFARKKSGTLTTFRRSRMLHTSNMGELFSRWLGSVTVGLLLIFAIWMALWTLISQLSGGWQSWHVACRFYLPVAVWLVVSYFTVVRFLAYLDLRIRREGWEIELAMRAEAAQLAAKTR